MHLRRPAIFGLDGRSTRPSHRCGRLLYIALRRSQADTAVLPSPRGTRCHRPVRRLVPLCGVEIVVDDRRRAVRAVLRDRGCAGCAGHGRQVGDEARRDSHDVAARARCRSAERQAASPRCAASRSVRLVQELHCRTPPAQSMAMLVRGDLGIDALTDRHGARAT
jgi:hypothetical protein